MIITKAHLILFFSLAILQTSYAQPSSEEDYMKLMCRTWVAYQETNHIPMLQRETTHQLVNNESRDSIIINMDGTVHRYHEGRICNGNWSFKYDLTLMTLKFYDCLENYYPLGSEDFILTTLSQDSIRMRCDKGPEGEYTDRLFKVFK